MKLYTALLSTAFLLHLSACGGSSGGNKTSEPPILSSSTASVAASSQAVSSIAASQVQSSTSNSSTSSSGISALSSSSTSNILISCNTKECETTNKELVQKIYTDIMNKNQVSSIENIFDTNMILNFTGSNSGSTGEAAHLQMLKNDNPGYIATIKHIAANHDYVSVHWHLSASPANEFSGKAVVDLYKITNNKIVAHWYLSQNVPSSTTSGNSLFSDLYTYSRTKPVATSTSETANRTLVTWVYLGLFNDKNLSLIDLYFANSYIQHNPYVYSGKEAFRAFVNSRTPGGLSFIGTLAEDDLVWTFNGADSLTGVDIFRLDNQMIVEHYDVF